MAANQLLRLDSRLALRAPEAAAALGISERKLRQLTPRLPVVRADGVVLYPVEALRRWLDEEVKRQRSESDATANEIFQKILQERT
jgi:hypothetical protein